MVWDHGKVVDLGSLGAGGLITAINPSGTVLGHREVAQLQVHATIWVKH